jgi:tripartite-type tricarboxylate transporter receptor subunit TctC
MLGPANVPEPIVKRLNSEINRVLKLPEFIEQLAIQGGEPMGGTPQEARRYTQMEIDRWMNLISKTNIAPQ